MTTSPSQDVLAAAARIGSLMPGQASIVVCGVTERRGVVGVVADIGHALSRLAGRRAIVADCDVADGRQSARLGHGAAPGVAEVLTGAAAAADVVIWRDDGFGFAPAGRGSGRAAGELLAGARAAQLPDIFGGFGLSLIVAPPLLRAVAGRLMAASAAGAVLMIHAGVDRRSDVVEAMDMLDAQGASVLGSVLLKRGRRRT